MKDAVFVGYNGGSQLPVTDTAEPARIERNTAAVKVLVSMIVQNFAGKSIAEAKVGEPDNAVWSAEVCSEMRSAEAAYSAGGFDVWHYIG